MAYDKPRGGTRGGKDQFKWEDVKSDPHRELYLGHSVLAPVGRWQRGRDLNWFAKEKKGGGGVDRDALAREREEFKRMEEDMRLEALGLKPRVDRRGQRELDDMEKKQLLERQQPGAEGEEEDELEGADRVEGLGFSSAGNSKGAACAPDSMGGVGITEEMIAQQSQRRGPALPSQSQAQLAAKANRIRGKLAKLAKKLRKADAKGVQRALELSRLDKDIERLKSGHKRRSRSSSKARKRDASRAKRKPDKRKRSVSSSSSSD